MSYKTSMEAFQYFPMTNCAIKRDASTIASDDSFDRDFAKCGFTNDLIESPYKIEFDLIHQVSLHVCADICGILGDENGDSGTIRLVLSAVTIATSQIVPPRSIDYLIPRSTPPSPSASTLKK